MWFIWELNSRLSAFLLPKASAFLTQYKCIYTYMHIFDRRCFMNIFMDWLSDALKADYFWRMNYTTINGKFIHSFINFIYFKVFFWFWDFQCPGVEAILSREHYLVCSEDDFRLTVVFYIFLTTRWQQLYFIYLCFTAPKRKRCTFD